jgi:hypothetical protein
MSTKIRLHWRTIVDPKHLRDGIHLRIIRLFAPASFREAEGWSIPYNAIVDLGSPFTILPKTIWEKIPQVDFLSELVPLRGLGQGTLMARLAKIELTFLDTRKELVTLAIKAYLAEDDAVPLLFGIEDLITGARLMCDDPKNKAFLQIA